MVKFLEVAPRIGMGFWVHPEVPKARVAALRQAFMSMLNSAGIPGRRKETQSAGEPGTG